MDEPYIPSDEPFPEIVEQRTLIYRGDYYYGKNCKWYSISLEYVIFNEVCLRHGNVNYVFKRMPQGYIRLVIGENYRDGALYELLATYAKRVLDARARGHEIALERKRAREENESAQGLKQRQLEPLRNPRKKPPAKKRPPTPLHPRLF